MMNNLIMYMYVIVTLKNVVKAVHTPQILVGWGDSKYQ